MHNIMSRHLLVFQLWFVTFWMSSFATAAVVDFVPWVRPSGKINEEWNMPASNAPPGDARRMLMTTSESFEHVFTELNKYSTASETAHLPGYFSQCLLDFAVLLNKPGDNVFQASLGLEAIDALGKPGSNVLYGNLQLLGGFDECFNIGEDLIKYWLVPMNFTVIITPDIPPIPFHLGMCIPRSCNQSSAADLGYFVNVSNAYLQNLTTNYGLVADYDNVATTSTKTMPLNTGAIIMIVVCVMFLALAVAGSLFHLGINIFKTLMSKQKVSVLNCDLQPHSEKAPLLGQSCQDGSAVQSSKFMAYLEKHLEFITAFSVFKNVTMILSTKQPSTAITSLNGIRVISMFWVILCHTYVWGYGYSTNPLYIAYHSAPRFSTQVIVNGFFSVDSFFFLSGLLVAYLTLREMERKNGRFPFITYYLHRYLRLTMVYAFLLFFWWNLTMYLGNGPMWESSLGVNSINYQACNKYWWTNLLYINNFHPWELNNSCMGWSWYLANDMQFYVLAPLILIPLYYIFPAGLVVSGAFLAVVFVANGAIAGTQQFSANMLLPAPHNANQFDDIYTKPYCRAAPYIVGLVLGFMLYKKIKISVHWLADWFIYIVIWLVAAGCCFSVVYGLYNSFHGHHLTLAENVSYIMFSRFVWSCGLALIVFACHNGYGWVINEFLSMKMWVPLSRLSYTAYLIHPIVLSVFFSSTRNPYTYTNYTIAVYAVAMVVLSYGAAGVVAVFVEFPLSNLEMAIFKAIGLKPRSSVRQIQTNTRSPETLIESEKNINIQE